jgi:hypothetical protein
MNMKKNEINESRYNYVRGIMSGNKILYCVLSIDRYSNRILESVYLDRKNAESYRNRSSQKLHIESETVTGYSGQTSVWCSNEWGPGDVLSFLNLHIDYDDAYSASYSNGRPSPVRVSDVNSDN